MRREIVVEILVYVFWRHCTFAARIGLLCSIGADSEDDAWFVTTNVRKTG